MIRSVVLPALGAFLVAGQPLRAQDRPALNLVTHSRVRIDRPAAAIWPLIVEPSAWKQGLQLSHHAGVNGQRGQVLAAKDPTTPSAVAFFVENVEVEINRRRTIKLFAPEGTLIGFAIWTLEEVAGGTVVGYDVFSETRLDRDRAAAMGAEGIREAERQATESNQKRFDDELMALKRLVERR